VFRNVSGGAVVTADFRLTAMRRLRITGLSFGVIAAVVLAALL
jgi:hypothetical protein